VEKKIVKPKEGSAKLHDAALQLVIQAYINHKTHARFQETQRSAFLVAYFGLVGIAAAPLFKKISAQEIIGTDERVMFIVSQCFLLLLGFWTALAIIKVGVEFRRHFHQAERIISQMQQTCDDADIKLLLSSAKMGTSGDDSDGLRRFVARRFGVASLHNYLISSILAAQIAIVVTLATPSTIWGSIAFPTALLAFVLLLNSYRRIIHTSLPPTSA
jgi:hypothetical protein